MNHTDFCYADVQSWDVEDLVINKSHDEGTMYEEWIVGPAGQRYVLRWRPTEYELLSDGRPFAIADASRLPLEFRPIR